MAALAFKKTSLGPRLGARKPIVQAFSPTRYSYWYISDALSTVRLVVDGSGTVVASYASDEFGNQTAATGSADLRQHTYTGGLGVRDNGAALGLLYMRQRYYDPSLGRWLSQDPIGFDGGLNLLVGMDNSPTNFVDPDGLKPARKSPQKPLNKTGINFFLGIPPKSVRYYVPSTKEYFWAPPEENFEVIVNTGKNNKRSFYNGPSQAVHMNDKVGHHGDFDVQRKWISEKDGCFYFYPKYTDAANFNVGLYLAGMGYTEQEALDTVHFFQSFKRTKNAGSNLVDHWTKLGWRAGASGKYPVEVERR